MVSQNENLLMRRVDVNLFSSDWKGANKTHSGARPRRPRSSPRAPGRWRDPPPPPAAAPWRAPGRCPRPPRRKVQVPQKSSLGIQNKRFSLVLEQCTPREEGGGREERGGRREEAGRVEGGWREVGGLVYQAGLSGSILPNEPELLKPGGGRLTFF